MLYIAAFILILGYSALRFIALRLSGYFLALIGGYVFFWGKMPETGAILLVGGVLIIILNRAKLYNRLPYDLTIKKTKKREGA